MFFFLNVAYSNLIDIYFYTIYERERGGYSETSLGWSYFMDTLLGRFRNCKLAVQSKVGLQRLAQLGYSNVHQWDVCLCAIKIIF